MLLPTKAAPVQEDSRECDAPVAPRQRHPDVPPRPASLLRQTWNVFTPRLTFFRWMQLQPVANFATRRRPRWCAGSSRPSRLSTIQYSSGVQLACHCSKRFPVRLLPSCTTICACWSSVTAFALPSQRSAQGSGCPVCDSTSPISGQPNVCAHCATFCPLPRSFARR